MCQTSLSAPRIASLSSALLQNSFLGVSTKYLSPRSISPYPSYLPSSINDGDGWDWSPLPTHFKITSPTLLLPNWIHFFQMQPFFTNIRFAEGSDHDRTINELLTGDCGNSTKGGPATAPLSPQYYQSSNPGWRMTQLSALRHVLSHALCREAVAS